MNEEEKRDVRFSTIKDIYTMVLKHGWYISVYHDKFDIRDMCFLIRSPDSTQKSVMRLPL